MITIHVPLWFMWVYLVLAGLNFILGVVQLILASIEKGLHRNGS